ncbi:hypothetical protein P7C70_g1035, partial [Phenoliferia sp. Uapishka_3]
MSASFLPPQIHASLFDSRQVEDDEGQNSDIGGEDLYEGTSNGPSHRNFAGTRPLTVESLLANRVQFVPQEHTQPLDDIPYTPINIQPSLSSPAPGTPAATTSSTSLSPASATPRLKASLKAPSQPASHLFPIIGSAVGWAKPYSVGPGLDNVGNTCFLNSALQVLLHTPPLVRYLDENNHVYADSCECCPIIVNSEAHIISPSGFAKDMRIGRQEDSHEFLRLFIEGMQKSELFGKDKKLPQEVKDSTFVNQIFGGRLRSRVTCLTCKHPSDTFDSILDVSLDIQRAKSLKDAFSNFVKVDELKGANKYKCEKCKKLVNAEKSFTIDKAPMVLSIHLKRFTPTGRKIGEQINYPETLSLGPYMSSRDQNGPMYRLYGVIQHSGGGPHSGHYMSYVKSFGGRWHHMNDSDVSNVPDNKPPLNVKSAYILFYCREKGDALTAAINAPTLSNVRPSGTPQTNTNGNGGKRPRDSLDNGFKTPGTNWSQPPPAKKAYTGAVPPVVVSTAFKSPFKTEGVELSKKQRKKEAKLANMMRGKSNRPAILA